MMYQVCESLYIGDLNSYLRVVAPQMELDGELNSYGRPTWGYVGEQGWVVVHACKDPYHRELLGYVGRGAPKEDPEYLVADRGDRFVLNLVDVTDPAYIQAECVDAGIEYIRRQLEAGKRVLVHCNQGASRAPALALAYRARYDIEYQEVSLESAIRDLLTEYPTVLLAGGVKGYLETNWARYQKLNRKHAR